MKSNEVLRLKCPKCGSTHKYLLELNISGILGGKMTKAPSKHTQKTFTQLFTCPKINEKFQAQIVLTETPNNRIEHINIIGIMKEGNNGS